MVSKEVKESCKKLAKNKKAINKLSRIVANKDALDSFYEMHKSVKKSGVSLVDSYNEIKYGKNLECKENCVWRSLAYSEKSNNCCLVEGCIRNKNLKDRYSKIKIKRS